jgi:hypothetical protein
MHSHSSCRQPTIHYSVLELKDGLYHSTDEMPPSPLFRVTGCLFYRQERKTQAEHMSSMTQYLLGNVDVLSVDFLHIPHRVTLV